MSFEILSTDKRIQAGLLKCLRNKSFRLITNSDIINEAEVSLRTFYRYYKDKNDLLDHMEDEIIKNLSAALDNDYATSIDQEKDTEDRVAQVSQKIMSDVLTFSIESKDVIKTLLSANGDLALWEKIKQKVETKFRESFKAIFGDHFVMNSYIQLQLSSYVDSKLVFILNWLDYTDTISVSQAEKLLNSTFSIKL